MTKKTLICVAALAFLFSFGLGVSFAVDAGPAEMELTTDKGKKPATFPHKAHQDKIKCADCHHGQDADGKQTAYTDGMAIQTCVTCHNDKMANAKLNDFKKAAHKNCKDCHTAESTAQNKPGLKKCGTCHTKDDGKE
ncbi:MAG: cytochrome c family protein [Proteobacteria bacterium]|nr:cytochrome c family protein [Pseudomonadota bacterium]MBU1710368.1 cytochrome c family protein [Pseudomonadota bacterium]